MDWHMSSLSGVFTVDSVKAGGGGVAVVKDQSRHVPCCTLSCEVQRAGEVNGTLCHCLTSTDTCVQIVCLESCLHKVLTGSSGLARL